MDWPTFKSSMAKASSPDAMIAALKGFADHLKATPASAAKFTKPEIVGVAMTKRKQNAELWSKEVALSFRSVMEAYQQASVLAKDAAAAPPVPAAAPHAGAGGAGAGTAGTDARLAAVVAPSDVSTCHATLQQFFSVFPQGDEDLVAEACEGVMAELRKHKENRRWSVEGNGPDHILYVARRALQSTHLPLPALNKFREAALRMLALCALHDETETTFFNKGAVEIAIAMARDAKSSLSVRGHAARLFFNLSYMRPNRPAFLRKGAMDHIDFVVTSVGDAVGDTIQQKMLLSMSKTLVQLACHPNCVKPMLCHPKFMAVWTKCAKHPNAEIRQRAAVVFSQCHENQLGLDPRFKPNVAQMANEVLHGAMSSDTSNAKVSTAMEQAQIFAKMTSGQVSVAPPRPPMRPPTVQPACDAKFRAYFEKFGSPDLTVARNHVTQCLNKLRGHKEWRADIVKGNGVELIMYAAHRGEPTGATPDAPMCLAGIRLIAEAALHDDTEDKFFQAGAFELAVRVAESAPTVEIKQHAARLAFNLTYLRDNRPRAIQKGALEHVKRMVLGTTGAAADGPTKAIILSTAKMCVQLACHAECVEPLFRHSSFKDVWLKLAQHQSPDVRQRAAAVFSKVASLNIGGAAAHRESIRYMIQEVMHGHISTDTSSQAVAARKMALTVTADLPDIDVSDCHPLFRDSFRGFYSPDAAVVDGSVDTALTTVQAAKERRPLACQGNGLKHMMKVLREAPDGSPAQLTAVRLCAEAGLHDDTEDLFFRAGAVEEAMRIARTTTNENTRPHATRFFFNMSYIRANREAFFDKGALDFAHQILTEFCTPGTHHADQMALHMAKAIVQLVCLPALVVRVASHPKFVACWTIFARHNDAQVRLRAAKIFNKVIDQSNEAMGGLAFGFLPDYHVLITEMTSGRLSSDSNSAVTQAKATIQENGYLPPFTVSVE